jgi:mannitol-1-/sugar-/sorbitol-6-/2-deoxyglucose-6-phosphatase
VSDVHDEVGAGLDLGVEGGLQAAVFDLDGLLVDSEPIWHEAEIRVLGEYGVPLTAEMCRQTKGRYVSEAVMHWHARYPWEPLDIDKVVAEILEAVDELVTTSLELKPGALHAIAACRDRGLRLAIASSAPDRIIRASLARFALEETFERSCSAEHEAAGKPDPAVFTTAANLLNIDAGRCVVFEDSPAGVRAAKAAGMLCVEVPEERDARGPQEPMPPAPAVAEVVLRSLEDLDDSVWATLQIGTGQTVRTVRPHRPPDRAPIVVVPGDALDVGDRDDQWPAFVLVTTATGAQGWVPLRHLTRAGLLEEMRFTVRQGHRYDTTELEVDPGTDLVVKEPDLGSGWLWCVDESAHEGWLPVGCVQTVAPTMPGG